MKIHKLISTLLCIFLLYVDLSYGLAPITDTSALVTHFTYEAIGKKAIHPIALTRYRRTKNPGEIIRFYQKRRKWSVAELAEKSGDAFNVPMILNILSGEELPSYFVSVLLGEVFNFDGEFFYEGYVLPAKLRKAFAVYVKKNRQKMVWPETNDEYSAEEVADILDDIEEGKAPLVEEIFRIVKRSFPENTEDISYRFRGVLDVLSEKSEGEKVRRISGNKTVSEIINEYSENLPTNSSGEISETRSRAITAFREKHYGLEAAKTLPGYLRTIEIGVALGFDGRDFYLNHVLPQEGKNLEKAVKKVRDIKSRTWSRDRKKVREPYQKKLEAFLKDFDFSNLEKPRPKRHDETPGEMLRRYRNQTPLAQTDIENITNRLIKQYPVSAYERNEYFPNYTSSIVLGAILGFDGEYFYERYVLPARRRSLGGIYLKGKLKEKYRQSEVLLTKLNRESADREYTLAELKNVMEGRQSPDLEMSRALGAILLFPADVFNYRYVEAPNQFPLRLEGGDIPVFSSRMTVGRALAKLRGEYSQAKVAAKMHQFIASAELSELERGRKKLTYLQAIEIGKAEGFDGKGFYKKYIVKPELRRLFPHESNLDLIPLRSV